MKHTVTVLLIISGILIAVGSGWYLAQVSFQGAATAPSESAMAAPSRSVTARGKPAPVAATSSLSGFNAVLHPAPKLHTASSVISGSQSFPTTSSTDSNPKMRPIQSVELSVAAAPRVRMSVPLALVQPEAPINMTAAEQGGLWHIQQEFGSAVGSMDDNPSDPVYQKRWLTAQQQADDRYRVQFGWQAFNRLTIERRRAELAGQPEEVYVPVVRP